ncbi:hypothetical protein B4168_3606 [Anoxybacillus flavithermus]|nr:hypothetical protein B4168_3606 [Anoxybacillus flavithermus]OAO87216.1 hypothetical protein GT23_1399 [Parageobacillus thermoglucosidasius]
MRIKRADGASPSKVIRQFLAYRQSQENIPFSLFTLSALLSLVS